MNTRWARVARGAITAAFATFVAAFLHVAAGGQTPGIVALAVTLAFAVLLCIALAGRRVALWRQSVSVALSQLLFHTLFSLGSTGPVLVAGTEHLHHDTQLGLAEVGGLSASPAATAMHGMHSAIWTNPLMCAAHGLAAIVTVLALRHGERTLARLGAITVLQVTSFASGVVVVVTPSVPRTIVASRSRIRVPHSLTVVAARLRHRGPPLPA